MKLSEIASSWHDGTTEGYLAVMDPEGNWTPESIFAFKAENKSDAQKCKAELTHKLKGSDTMVKMAKVDDVYIVLTYDHRADMDEVHPLGFGDNKERLEERLRKDIDDDELNIDADLFAETVVFQYIRMNGDPSIQK